MKTQDDNAIDFAIRKEKLLKSILDAEAMEAEFGSKASKLRTEYAEKYSPLKKGDKIIITYDDGSFKCNAIIHTVKFDTHELWVYVCFPVTKNWTKPKRRRDFITVASNPQRAKHSIYRFKKATE